MSEYRSIAEPAVVDYCAISN